jgi:hypothetical protein
MKSDTRAWRLRRSRIQASAQYDSDGRTGPRAPAARGAGPKSAGDRTRMGVGASRTPVALPPRAASAAAPPVVSGALTPALPPR